MTKLNFVQAKHPQALSYVTVQSDPAAEPEQKTLSDWLDGLADWVTEFLIMFCAGSGFVFWLVILALMS